MRKFELFEMDDYETVMDMYTRFTDITNELKSLGKSFTTEELVRKILRFLTYSWLSRLKISKPMSLVEIPNKKK